MSKALGGLASFLGSATLWLCDKIWGDTIFSWVKPMIPERVVAGVQLNGLVGSIISYAPPAALAALGFYLFWSTLRRDKRLAVAAPPAQKQQAAPALSALSSEHLRRAAIDYATRIRTFERNSHTQIDLQTSGGDPPPQGNTGDEANRNEWLKRLHANRERQGIKRTAMRGQMELVFYNEHAQIGRDMEGALTARLASVGILGPYGTGSERRVLDGFLSGPYPICEFADYLERNARKLPQ